MPTSWSVDRLVRVIDPALSGDLRRYQQAVREHYEPLLAILDTVADRAPTKENQ